MRTYLGRPPLVENGCNEYLVSSFTTQAKPHSKANLLYSHNFISPENMEEESIHKSHGKFPIPKENLVE